MPKTKKLIALCLAIALCLTGIGDYVVSRAEENPRENVALASNGTRATTSDINVWAEENGYGFMNLNDGITGGNQFMTAMSTDQSFETKQMKVFLLFQRTYQVDAVKLYKADGQNNYGIPVDFEIQAYTASGWQTVVTQTNYQASDGANEFTFAPVDCSAVALVTTKNSYTDQWSGYGIFLKEFEVWGTKSSTEVPAPDMSGVEDSFMGSYNVALASKGTTVETDYVNEWAEGAGYGIQNMIDGAVTGNEVKPGMTAGGSGYEWTEQTVTLTFQRLCRVNRVGLYKYDNGTDHGFPVDFEIQANTASGWKTVVSKTGYSAQSGRNDFEFDTVDCSQVRLVSKRNSPSGAGNYSICLMEFAVYGTKAPSNMALASKGTKASTSYPNEWAENNGYGIVKLNDGLWGDNDKFFMTDMKMDEAYKTEEMKVFLQLPETYRVDTVRLHKAKDGGFPRGFELRAYTASGWQTVVTKTDYDAQEGWNEFSFSPVDCSAMALVTTENGWEKNSGFGIYLSEFGIYGEKATTKVAAPDISEDLDPLRRRGNVALASKGTKAFTNYPNEWAEGEGYGIASLNDGLAGDDQKYFMTDMNPAYQKEEMKVFLQLPGTFAVDTVRLHTSKEGAFPVSFELRAYTASGWQTVVAKTGYSAQNGWNDFAFNPVECAALALVTTENGVASDGNYGVFLSEFEAYGKKVSTTVAAPDISEDLDPSRRRGNVALAANGATVATNYPNEWAEKEGYGIANLNDGLAGDDNKFFMTEMNPAYQKEEMKVFLLLPGTFAVDTVRLHTSKEGAFPVSFEIRAYTASGWQPVVRKTGYSPQSGWNEFTFNTVDCSALALVTTENGRASDGNYGIFLSEFEAYGKKSSASVSAPDISEEINPSAKRANVALAVNGAKAATNYPNEWAEKEGYGIANLTDGIFGDDNKFFMTAMNSAYQKEEMKVFLQLSGTFTVDTVRLHTAKEGAFPVSFEIQAYTALGWKTVVSQKGYSPTKGWNEFAFDPVDCSALALVTTENGRASDGNYGIFLSEFEAYGKKASSSVAAPDISEDLDPSAKRANVALAVNGATVVTNYPNDWGEKEGYGIANLNDGLFGDDNKFFMTAMNTAYQKEEMKVFLLLSKTYAVDTVRLHTAKEGAFPVSFEIRAYTASGWQTVVSQKGYSPAKGWNEFAFDPVDCSALALVTSENGMASDGNYGIFLSEFEAYGKKAATTVELPDISGEADPAMRRANIALAVNGTTASTNYPNEWGEKEGYGVINLNDGLFGDDNKFFMTAMDPMFQKEEMKVFLVFQDTYQVDTIRLHTSKEGAFPVSFEIRAYTASGWQTIVSQSGYSPQTGWNEFKFDPVDCSAVALVTSENGVASDGNYGIFLSEFEVYGKKAATTVPVPDVSGESDPAMRRANIALAANGTVASTSHANEWGEKEGYGIVNLNDGLFGDDNKFFMTAMDPEYQKEEMKVFLVFKDTYLIDTIRLHTSKEGAFPVSFELWAYTASGWKTIVSQNGYNAQKGWNEFKFDPVDCSAVALATTENGVASDGNYGIFLSEFEVYGKKATTAIPAPSIGGYLNKASNGVAADNNDDVGDVEKNIALYMPAASRTDLAKWGMGPEKLTDGDIFTMWSCDTGEAGEGTAEWVEINLLDNYAVNEVVLYARAKGWGFPIDFTISIFYDDEWMEVVNETGYETTTEDVITAHSFKFPDTIGNKIRINATKMNPADGEYCLQFMEVAAYGERMEGDYVLPNANIVNNNVIITTSTSLEDYGYYKDYLIDSDVETGYSSEQYDSSEHEEWIEMDFRRAMKVSEVQLKPAWSGNGFPDDLRIEVWEDEAWVPAMAVENYEKPLDVAWQKFALDRQHLTQKIRIAVPKLGRDFGQYSLKLNEIEAYLFETDEEGRGAMEVVDSSRTEYTPAETLGAAVTDNENKLARMAFAFGIGMFALALAGGAGGGIFLLVKKRKGRAVSQNP